MRKGERSKENGIAQLTNILVTPRERGLAQRTCCEDRRREGAEWVVFDDLIVAFSQPPHFRPKRRPPLVDEAMLTNRPYSPALQSGGRAPEHDMTTATTAPADSNTCKRTLTTSHFLLGAVAGLLALNLVASLTGVKFPPQAMGQTQSRGAGGENVNDPPFNAGGQRKQMIDQLVQLNDKIARIEARLDRGLSVKVTEMPAISLKAAENK